MLLMWSEINGVWTADWMVQWGEWVAGICVVVYETIPDHRAEEKLANTGTHSKSSVSAYTHECLHSYRAKASLDRPLYSTVAPYSERRQLLWPEQLLQCVLTRA
jgi:cephalosporin hydroxylase